MIGLVRSHDGRESFDNKAETKKKKQIVFSSVIFKTPTGLLFVKADFENNDGTVVLVFERPGRTSIPSPSR